MKKFKGTQKEFSAYPDAFEHNHKFTSHPFLCDVLVDGRRFEEKIIARVFGDTKEEAQANAKLFASSKELVEKLKLALEYKFMSEMEKLAFEQDVKELLDTVL